MSSKAVLIFPKNFLNFRSNIIEKQGIINVSSYSCKSYDSVVLRAFFLDEGEDATFRPFFYCILFIHSVGKSEKYVFKFSCLPYFRMYFVEDSYFSAFNFVNIALNFFSLNCPSLMSSWLLLIFLNRFIRGFRRLSKVDSWNILFISETFKTCF